MKAGNIITGLIGLACLMQACDDIIEPDISKKTITLTSPADSTTSKTVTQTFQWEELTGALQYRFQASSPSFDNPADFFIDTVVVNNRFTLTLVPGNYQWRVGGLNGAYQTAFRTRSFSIDSTSSLSSQVLLLLNPANKQTLDSMTITFLWQNLPMADSYLFKIVSQPAFDTVVYTNTIRKSFPAIDTTYQWKVVAMNSFSLKESASFYFSIDVTPPVAPTLLMPATDATLPELPATCSWKRNSSDITNDSIFLFSATQSLITGYPKAVNGTSYTIEDTATLKSGTYYWAVKSVDRSRKVSEMSEQRKFTLP